MDVTPGWSIKLWTGVEQKQDLDFRNFRLAYPFPLITSKCLKAKEARAGENGESKSIEFHFQTRRCWLTLTELQLFVRFQIPFFILICDKKVLIGNTLLGKYVFFKVRKSFQFTTVTVPFWQSPQWEYHWNCPFCFSVLYSYRQVF